MENRNSSYTRYGKRMWYAAITFAVLFILFFVILSFQGLPDFKQLENPDFELATQVIDIKSREIGRYYTQNRLPVTYNELNPFLIDALVATEDVRYFSHSGVDVQALSRVIMGVITFNTRKGGGSTITQQLAKLLFDRPDFEGMGKMKKTWTLVITKFKEWITAVKLEKQYTKQEILAMYLNKFNFIYGAYGISAASEIYFGKNQKDLKIEEAATLIGMLNNPALFNPIRRPDTVMSRRMIVLNQMRKEDYITRHQYDSLRVLPLDLSHFSRQSHETGPAPYFRAELANWLKALFEKAEYRKSNGEKYNIYEDGLKVYTTIDLDMQQMAEEEMWKHMSSVQEKYNKVWEGMDPWTYHADDMQKKIRKESLTHLIRQSGRYVGLREARLNEILDKIQAAHDIQLTDWDIENILQETQKAGRIARLVSGKTISPDRGKKYKEVMTGELWPQLASIWNDFQKEVMKEMNTPVDMMVFDYNPKGEKKAHMSPLDSIKYHRKFLQTGILAIDPKTGEVKTWVGGINNKYFQFDHTGASRQVGSTFKPFVYATAITLQGISPCFPVLDQPYTIGPGDGSFGLQSSWTPNNADGKYTGRTFTLFEGLRDSRNTISVFLMQQLGNANVVRGLINNMGIDSSTRRSDGEYRVPNQPSICLGAADLSVMEMTGAYCTFANNGVFVKPYFVSSIEDPNGKVIYRAVKEEQVALPPKANAVMVDMLKFAADYAFRDFKSEVGGKTGTTNDYVDGWFMGVTPSLVVGTWVGGEDPWIRFNSLADGQGAVMARPFFKAFLGRLENSTTTDYDPNAKFEKPVGGLDIETDCNKYNAMRRQNGIIDHFDPKTYEEEFNEN
ncbi:MAG: transglycosylase domain-containing protein [Saprospiraceae bacterium]|uniref:Transglycosylase domain-containing protein n=1 Tax=Candidatus Opimibacter skivensis TaxID=2982028 RepID=A0A9D7XUK2_9BACT|nr:transglycosylase domain-containing protein [Candidatus Opimibacter skivensis]